MSDDVKKENDKVTAPPPPPPPPPDGKEQKSEDAKTDSGVQKEDDSNQTKVKFNLDEFTANTVVSITSLIIDTVARPFEYLTNLTKIYLLMSNKNKVKVLRTAVIVNLLFLLAVNKSFSIISTGSIYLSIAMTGLLSLLLYVRLDNNTLVKEEIKNETKDVEVVSEVKTVKLVRDKNVSKRDNSDIKKIIAMANKASDSSASTDIVVEEDYAASLGEGIEEFGFIMEEGLEDLNLNQPKHFAGPERSYL